MKGINKTVNIKKIIIFSMIVAAVALFPVFVHSNYIISVAVTCFLFSGFGICWNMISGYGGQISWCHSAFVAIGAYTMIIMNNELGLSPFFALPVSMAITFVIATIIGKISFRYRGPFFAITTIAFAEIIRVVLLNLRELTGGSAGITIPYVGVSFWRLQFKNDTPFFYLMFIVVMLLVFITYSFERSKWGYYLKSIKGDEDAAISLGIDTSHVKLLTFQISAVLTAALGVFYAAFINYVQPNTISGMDLSVKIGSVVIVGGIGTVWGSLVGAFILIPLIEVTNIILGAQGGSQLLYGLALIVVVIIQPQGIIYMFNKEARLEAAVKRRAWVRKIKGVLTDREKEGKT